MPYLTSRQCIQIEYLQLNSHCKFHSRTTDCVSNYVFSLFLSCRAGNTAKLNYKAVGKLQARAYVCDSYWTRGATLSKSGLHHELRYLLVKGVFGCEFCVSVRRVGKPLFCQVPKTRVQFVYIAVCLLFAGVSCTPFPFVTSLSLSLGQSTLCGKVQFSSFSLPLNK